MPHMPRDRARALGEEAVRLLDAGRYSAPSGRQVNIAEFVQRSVAGTREYPPDVDVAQPRRGEARCCLSIENDTVLAVGRRMADEGRVAALNFASATSPGGGFLNGARAQEESIARSSSLYACLSGREMYPYHRGRHDAMYTDYAIHSPDVLVFRTDDGDLLEDAWTMSVVTCAAVNGRALERYAPERLPDVRDVMLHRTLRMLSVFAAHDERRLILGAWGCGAFGLDAVMMAEAFHEALTGPFDAVFDEIVFAITDWRPGRDVIRPFRERFIGG